MSVGISKTGLTTVCALLLLWAVAVRASDISENSFEPANGNFTTVSSGCSKKLILGTNEDVVELQCGPTGGPLVFPYVLPQDAGTSPSIQYFVTYGIDGVCSGGTNNGGRCKAGADCPSGSCVSQGSVRCQAQMRMVCYPTGALLNAPIGSSQTYTQSLDSNPGPGKVWNQGGQEASAHPFNVLTNTTCGGECRDTVCQVNFSFVAVSSPATYCNLRQLRLQYNRF